MEKIAEQSFKGKYDRYPKELHVVIVWCSLKEQPSTAVAESEFRKLMPVFDTDSYGILMKVNNVWYGLVGYADEPLALPLDVKFHQSHIGAWCTHDFVDELKSYRRRTQQAVGEDEDDLSIVVYNNPRTRMTKKSCKKHCLRNVRMENAQKFHTVIAQIADEAASNNVDQL